MATATMTRLIADLRGDLPGAILSAVQAALYAAADEFLEETNAWDEEIVVPITTIDLSYTLTTVTGGQINRLMLLYNSTDPDKRPVSAVSMEQPGILTIPTAATVAATWVAKVSKRLLTVDADGNPDMPDWLIEQYRGGFLFGTLSRMRMSVNKPYSQVQLGMLNGKQFITEKTKAKINVAAANVRGQQTWQYPTQGGYIISSQRRMG